MPISTNKMQRVWGYYAGTWQWLNCCSARTLYCALFLHAHSKGDCVQRHVLVGTAVVRSDCQLPIVSRSYVPSRTSPSVTAAFRSTVSPLHSGREYCSAQ